MYVSTSRARDAFVLHFQLLSLVRCEAFDILYDSEAVREYVIEDTRVFKIQQERECGVIQNPAREREELFKIQQQRERWSREERERERRRRRRRR